MKALNELTKNIVSAFSFLGVLASVMRKNSIPLKKTAKVSSSKGGVTESASQWECTRSEQARLMLVHFKSEDLTRDAIEDMELQIISHNAFAKAGYAIEEATGEKVDTLHKAFLALTEGAKNVAPTAAAPVKVEEKVELKKAA